MSGSRWNRTSNIILISRPARVRSEAEVRAAGARADVFVESTPGVESVQVRARAHARFGRVVDTAFSPALISWPPTTASPSGATEVDHRRRIADDLLDLGRPDGVLVVDPDLPLFRMLGDRKQSWLIAFRVVSLPAGCSSRGRTIRARSR